MSTGGDGTAPSKKDVDLQVDERVGVPSEDVVRLGREVQELLEVLAVAPAHGVCHLRSEDEGSALALGEERQGGKKGNRRGWRRDVSSLLVRLLTRSLAQ